jgi:hypothetical protein
LEQLFCNINKLSLKLRIKPYELHYKLFLGYYETIYY